MDYFAISDIGKSRQNNEDCYLADGSNLFIVADGMGGHKAGEIASRIAIDNFSSFFKKKYEHHLNKKATDTDEINDKNIQKLLIDAVNDANKKIYDLGSKNEDMSGMGTTLTSLFILNSSAYVTHVGDSRLYLFRKDKLNLLTEDHTLVFQLYKRGVISYEDTFSHPQRNYLTGVLGGNEISSLECFKFTFESDDIIIICSDGLNSMIKDISIENILKKLKNKTARDIAQKLVLTANKKGGNDNITVIILKL
ncbi:Stp1/IreP family PP2C-type Ser/Thr phosphatase [bacterium]|nr:Stp1/IreP family PP2C-type Ser/Thr phosphatase [bacterium]